MKSGCFFGAKRSVSKKQSAFVWIVLLLLAMLLFACDSGSSGCDSDTEPNDPAPQEIEVQWSEPSTDTTVSGTLQLSLTGSGLVNVEVFYNGNMIARCDVADDGQSARAQIDTTQFADGPITLTAHAWNSPPGEPFTLDTDAGELTFRVKNDGGGNDNGGNDDGNDDIGGGRKFLNGFFSAGSTIPNYTTFLGYSPEFTYNSSYQDDHHKNCGQGIWGLNEISTYPVIVSVFTTSNGGSSPDYAGTAAGKNDHCYEQVFSELAERADQIYAVRIDVEFWPDPPAAEFKGSFNRIVSIAKKYLPERIKYVFNPNWEKPLGADYVPESADIIGPDAYNNPQWNGPDSTAAAKKKFDPNHGGSIAYWTKIAQQLGKKMALPEWGDDYGDGVFIDYVADWAFDKVLVTPGQSNNVVYLGYWDSNLVEDAHLRGNSMTVFKNRFANIPYTGTYWGPLIPTVPWGNFKGDDGSGDDGTGYGDDGSGDDGTGDGNDGSGDDVDPTEISAAWAEPAPNADLSGTVVFRLVGSGLVNVEIFHNGSMIARCAVADNGKSAQAQIDTTRFANGAVTLTAHAWNSPAGESFTLDTDAGELTFMAANEGNDDNDNGGGSSEESSFVPAGYRKVFGDEFDGTKDNAFYDRWNTLAPWGVQWYSDSDQQQAFIDEGVILRDGLCLFEAKKSDVLLSDYQWISSGSLTTNRTFVHGYFEAKVWMPDADQKGAWPAFWLTSSTRWPPEWDIFEIVSSDWQTIFQYDHMPSGQSSRNLSGSSEYRGVDVRDGYHIYGFLWTSDEISWFVDGVLTRKVNVSGAGDDTMWLNVSQQVGGSWPGYPDASTKWPMNMYVDYVRVYQK